VSANDALGSSRHTRSRGISHDFINASTPCSWHSTCACAGAGGVESEVLVKVVDKEALVALERFVDARDASGRQVLQACACAILYDKMHDVRVCVLAHFVL